MKDENSNLICPLCQTSKPYSFFEVFFQDKREFFRCPVCLLVFVLPKQFLTPAEEKSVYDLHENSSSDVHYRRFLERLFIPVTNNLAPHSHGLDFGSGPGPTLSVMFEEAGHSMHVYDPFYAPDIKPLQQTYDFITASEVAEHLHQPGQELDRLWSCLNADGILGIMTKRVISREAFSNWHYKSDPTHVCFFSVDTFQWLAERWDAELIIADNDVVLFKKTLHAASLQR